MATEVKRFSQEILEGQTFLYTAVISDEAGDVIDLTDALVLLTCDFTLYDADTAVHVGSREDQDVLGIAVGDIYPGDNNHTLAVNGTLTYRATVADTSTAGTHKGRYVYTYLDGGAVIRTTIHEFQFVITALDTVT